MKQRQGIGWQDMTADALQLNAGTGFVETIAKDIAL